MGSEIHTSCIPVVCLLSHLHNADLYRVCLKLRLILVLIQVMIESYHFLVFLSYTIVDIRHKTEGIRSLFQTKVHGINIHINVNVVCINRRPFTPHGALGGGKR